MKKVAIVVIAYNRENSLKRILKSLNDAEYENDSIDLIISIDFNENHKVYSISDDFLWKNGEKIVIKHKSNLGLRKHVLECGDLSKVYENIIILEDDIFVSKGFYNFSKQAIKFYEDDDSIAGISLYSPNYNETCRRPFIPIKDSSDVYFIQYPSSWGQIWSNRQWAKFREWYDENSSNKIDETSTLPNNIIAWPESSWKKYFIKYMHEQNKFFVYPYTSLTTNFGDEGTHFRNETSTFQVPITDFNNKYIYKFIDIKNSKSIYDVYMENIFLKDKLTAELGEEVTIDLYGMKVMNFDTRFILSVRNLNYNIVKEFGMKLRPHEMNIYSEIEGETFRLYDVKVIKRNRFKNKSYEEIVYDLFSLNKISIALRFIIGRLKIYIRYLIKKIFKMKS